ncbi:MAG: hypothetical protein PUB21_11820 [Bacteroidales bacterium]|nr:hypothetical protein [Bacteroidales bacterium]
MYMKFQTYNGKVIYADTPEEFITQFCKGDLLTQEMSVQECMDDYASKAKEHNNIHIPTDTPLNFINALYRMGYIIKLE